MKLPLGGCFPWESFLYSEKSVQTLRGQQNACWFSTQGSFLWHSWAECSSSGAAPWASSCCRSLGGVHSMGTRQWGDTSQLRVPPKKQTQQLQMCSPSVHSWTAPTRSLLALRVAGLHHEEPRRRKHGVLFSPLAFFFCFLNDYHNNNNNKSQPKYSQRA